MTMFELTQLVVDAARDYKCRYDIKISSKFNQVSKFDTVTVTFYKVMKDGVRFEETIPFGVYNIDGEDLIYIIDGAWESPYPVYPSDIDDIVEGILSVIADAAEKYRKEHFKK